MPEPMSDADLAAIRERWSNEQTRPGGTIARDTIFALLAEIDRRRAKETE